jgi:hypothetical protein
MWILRYGSIFNSPRTYLCDKSKILNKLFNCSLCLGFWCGLIVGFFNYFYIQESLVYILFPFASSACCWFFDSLLDLIQLSCNFLDKKD